MKVKMHLDFILYILEKYLQSEITCKEFGDLKFSIVYSSWSL
jgi:hypothetical protein